MNKFKAGIWKVLNMLSLSGPLQLLLTGYLKDSGWFKSHKQKQAVDRLGQPIPWCSYPFIHFIEERLSTTMNVFEYGCGNSTRWYAQRVGKVRAVDHDAFWVTHINKLLPSTAKVYYEEKIEEGLYAKAIALEEQKYQIVVVDGRDRNRCLQYSLEGLSEDGVIILDNSQLPEYNTGIQFLLQKGFKRIDFYGMVPVVPSINNTTIFYKSGNCLNI